MDQKHDLRNKLVLHIGMPKTGSTFIQRCLALSRNSLKSGGVLVPVEGTTPRHPATHNDFFFSAYEEFPAHLKTKISQSKRPFPDYVERILREKENASCHTVLLSSENVWNPRDYGMDKFLRIRDAFTDFDVFVLVYLRNVYDHFKASYGQQVRSGFGTVREGFSGTVQEFLEAAMEGGLYRYKERLDALGEVFGRDAIRACRYEEARSASICAPLEALLTELSGKQTTLVKAEKDANVSPNWLYIRVANVENRVFKRSRVLGLTLTYLRLFLNRRFLRRMFKSDRWSPITSKMRDRLRSAGETRMAHVEKCYNLNWWRGSKDSVEKRE